MVLKPQLWKQHILLDLAGLGVTSEEWWLQLSRFCVNSATLSLPLTRSRAVMMSVFSPGLSLTLS